MTGKLVTILLGMLSLQSVAAEQPHPLLVAVCQNDYASVAAQAPQQLTLPTIVWGKQKLTALDLALANDYQKIARLLQYSGAVVSQRTLNVVCNPQQAKTMCDRNVRWQQNSTCRKAYDPSRWYKSCRTPDKNCEKILQQLANTLP